MKKNQIIGSLAIATLLVTGFTACDNRNKPVETTQNNAKNAQTELKIAYIEVDSIMTQYKFCKEYAQILEKKGQNIQKTLSDKQMQLQSAAANFQQKIQQNAYTREQAEAIQAGLQKQNQDLQMLNQRLSAEFQKETEQFNKALRDSIQHYLASYNKDRKYSLILSKQGDNLLYADKSFDITKEVVMGLNKAYKSNVKKEGTKK